MSYCFLMDDSENCTSLQVREGAYWAECFSDIPASVLSRLNLTAAKSSCSDSETESYPGSQSGTTCEHSTANHGGDSLTLCVEGSRVRTYPAELKTHLESLVNALDCGPKWPGSLARFDLRTRSWRTAQCLLQGGLELLSGTWPKWGMSQDGELFPLSMPGPLTEESEFGLLPTMQASDWQPICYHRTERMLNGLVACENGGGCANLPDYAALLWMKAEGITKRPPAGKRPTLNLRWWEKLMLWPIGWTDLKPLAMDKFAEWWSLHGKSLADLPQTLLRKLDKDK